MSHAGLSNSLRRAGGVDLRAKQAYAEQLRAQESGADAAYEATARTVSAPVRKTCGVGHQLVSTSIFVNFCCGLVVYLV